MSTEETSPPPPLPDRNILLLPAANAARLLVGRFVAEAHAAFERLDNASDEAALHDFRVAWRRLRTTMRAYRPQLRSVVSKSIRTAVREIAEISGDSRDLEVYLQCLAARQTDDAAEKQAILWLTRIFTARKNAANPGGLSQALAGFPAVHAAIDEALTRNNKVRWAPGSMSLAVVVGERLTDASKELEKLLGKVHSISDQDEVHRARISGKRLRYLLEPLVEAEADAKPLVESLKHLQDDVGELRDKNLFRSEIELLLDAESAILHEPGLREGLEAVVRQLRTDESRAYHRMRSRWSRKANKAFFARAAGLAHALTAMGAFAHKNVEIERKYLLKGFPKRAKAARCVEIEQGWLPGERFAERLRRARTGGRNRYYRTVKLGAGVRRIELEESTTRAIFDFMWPLTAGKRVSKCRYVVRDSGLDWEIDEFKDRELILAEVELNDAGVVPSIPRWLRPYVVREVTDEPEYLNRNLAK